MVSPGIRLPDHVGFGSLAWLRYRFDFSHNRRRNTDSHRIALPREAHKKAREVQRLSSPASPRGIRAPDPLLRASARSSKGRLSFLYVRAASCPRLQLIEWAPDGVSASLHDMGIDHGRLDVGMPE